MSIVGDMAHHVARALWVELMDIVVCYRATLQTRRNRQWTALCQAKDNPSSYLVFERDPYGRPDAFAGDLENARIDRKGVNLQVQIPTLKPPVNRRLEVVYDPQVKDLVVVDRNGGTWDQGMYEINERFAAFGWVVLCDILKNGPHYEHWWRRLTCNAPARGRVPQNRSDTLRRAADPKVPFLAIEGPPGTGKTSFLADIVSAWVASGVRPGSIACLAQTHRAADEIFRKLLELISANKLPANALPQGTNGQRPRRHIRDAGDHIYVGTIHSGGPTARDFRRAFVLIDECSQIALPVFLYGLRYATDRAVIRVFGDTRQLPPVTPYVRDLNLPDWSFDDVRSRYLRIVGEKGQRFLDHMQRWMLFAHGCGPTSFDEAVRKKGLQDLQHWLISSACGQSPLTVGDFLRSPLSEKASSQADFGKLARFVANCTLYLTEDYRHERSLHDMTRSVFYPAAGSTQHSAYRCAFDLVATNLGEVVHHVAKNPQHPPLQLLRHLFRSSFPSNALQTLVARLAAGAFLQRGPWRRSDLLGLLSPQEKTALRRDVKPFCTRTCSSIRGDLGSTIFASPQFQGAAQQVCPSVDAQRVGQALQRYLPQVVRSRLLLITHDCEPAGNRNDLEVLLTAVLLRLWENEPFRVLYKVGCVTPYRAQEHAVRTFYHRAFGHTELVRDPGWVATPERYQGRDISRAVVSIVDDDASFSGRGPSTMYSANKLNVATSRSGSQLVLVVHRSMIDPDCVDAFAGNVRETTYSAAEREILEGHALPYRRKLLALANHIANEGCRIDLRQVV